MLKDWSVLFLALYFVVVLLAARLFARQAVTLKDYFLAGRSLGSWPVALTFAASWFGATSTMGSINAFHQYGLSGAWMLVIPSLLCFIVITGGLAKRVAQQPYLSQPEAIEAQYGRAGRFLLALVILVASTVLIGSQMVAAGKVFQTVFGLDIVLATLICTSVVVAYAAVGGYFTVVVTDVIQIALVILAFVVLFGFTLTQAVPDTAAWQTFLVQQPAHFWDITYGWREHVFLVFTFVLGWSIAPEMWQRMSSTRNPELAFWAGLQGGLILTGLFALVVSIGLLSSQLVPAGDDAVLVSLIQQIGHPVVAALVMLGLIAAVTSSMDSTLNVGSLTLTHDLYRGFFRPQASMQELLWVGRIATVLIVLPAMAIALAFQDIIRILWVSADIYASSMFVPIVGLLYLRRPGRWSGILAMGLGGLTATLGALFQYGVLPNTLNWPGYPYSTLLGVGMSLVGFLIGLSLSRRTLRRTVATPEVLERPVALATPHHNDPEDASS